MPAESPGLNKDPSRSDVKDAVLKSRGILNLDDLDAAPQLLTLQAHHELVVIVELCEAQRPSKLGSLGGSHAKYEDTYNNLESWLSGLAGNGSVRLQKWEAGMPTAQAGAAAFAASFF